MKQFIILNLLGILILTDWSCQNNKSIKTQECEEINIPKNGEVLLCYIFLHSIERRHAYSNNQLYESDLDFLKREVNQFEFDSKRIGCYSLDGFNNIQEVKIPIFVQKKEYESNLKLWKQFNSTSAIPK